MDEEKFFEFLAVLFLAVALSTVALATMSRNQLQRQAQITAKVYTENPESYILVFQDESELVTLPVSGQIFIDVQVYDSVALSCPNSDSPLIDCNLFDNVFSQR